MSQGHQPHVLPIQSAFDEGKQSRFVKRPKLTGGKKGPPKKKWDLDYREGQNDRTHDGKSVEIDDDKKIEILNPNENRIKESHEDSNEIKPLRGHQENEPAEPKEDGQQHEENEFGNKKLNENKRGGISSKDGALKVPSSSEHNSRQRDVVAAFRHAWKGYKAHAWGKDELRPISRGYSTWFDIGLTMVDSLDTMWLMDLREEFTEAKNWVKNSLQFHSNKYVNVFEVTIRVLGSLLSTYHLSGDKEFLDKAVSIFSMQGALRPKFSTAFVYNFI